MGSQAAGHAELGTRHGARLRTVLHDQITILYRSCLDRGLCSNALELSELAYQGDLDEGKRSLRVWMPKIVAKDIKVEEKESVPVGLATAGAAVPQTGAATGDGGNSSKAEPSDERPDAAMESQLKAEPPPPPPLFWRAVVSDLIKLEWKRANPDKNPMRPSKGELLRQRADLHWQPMDVPSSADPDEVRCEFRADVSWDAIIPLPDVTMLTDQMLAFCQNERGEPVPCAINQ